MSETAGRPPGRMESAVLPELVIEAGGDGAGEPDPGPAGPTGMAGSARREVPGCPENVARPAPGPIRTGRDPETGECRIEIARVGRYRFVPGAPEVNVEPFAGTSPTTVHAAYLATVLPLALQAAGHQLLHASAIETASGVIAFCGHSSAGKSTLAAAFARRGHPQWADDAVWWEIERDEDGEPIGARTRRLPFQQRLRPDAARWLGLGHAEAPLESPVSPKGSVSREPTIRPLKAAYLLAPRTEEAHTKIPPPNPLRLTQAFPALLDNAYCFDTGNQALGALADSYLALAIAMPVSRLVLPDGLDRLEAAMRGRPRRPRPGGSREVPVDIAPVEAADEDVAVFF